MKSLTLIALLVLVTACGQGGGGGGGKGPSTEQSSNEVRTACDTPVKNGDLMETAVSANKVRKDCNLTEDEAVKAVTK